jgi:outer membrane protein TolC
MRNAWLLCCVIGIAPIANAESLNFSDAVARAGADGPTIEARAAGLSAAKRAIKSAGQLPDPELALGLDSFPVSGPNAGSFTRDDFTWVNVGIMQDMPSGAKRSARTKVAMAGAGRAAAELEVGRLEARLGAAKSWLSLYYAERRQALLDQLASDARAAANTARARLAAGGAVDDALAAEVDAARLEDRKDDNKATMAAARADLRRWIGNAADARLAEEPPIFSIDPDLFRAHLIRHPALAAMDAETSEAEANVGLARAETHPDWSWGLSYQRRDPRFGDYVSAEVRIGLPLFQGARQRPMINSKLDEVSRIGAERAALLREHSAALESRLAERDALLANLQRARDIRLPLARQRASASVGALAAGASSVKQSLDARRDTFEAELDLIDLEERLSELNARLTLEYGDTAP